MMIGVEHSAQDSLTGQTRPLTPDAAETPLPDPSHDSDNAPDWRVLLGDAETGTEIGAGWNRTGERAGAFVAVQIDDPAFAQPLRANLLRSMSRDDEHHLLWSRPTNRDRK
mgnify:CR=1 FL=1